MQKTTYKSTTTKIQNIRYKIQNTKYDDKFGNVSSLARGRMATSRHTSLHP